MERVLAIAILVILTVASARAETEVVVVGPAVGKNVRKPVTADVSRALARASLRRVDARVDRTCAADTTCIANAAAGELRALAVAIEMRGKQVAVELALVDVEVRELLAKRDVVLATNRIARDLGPAVTKFLAEAPIERAKELFAKGNQHYNLGELAEALVIYKRAYQITPLPAFLFNIGQCHRKLGQHQDAITMYQAYLVGVPDAENKALVEDLIAESRAAIAAAERRESERLTAERARVEELRRAREAEALAARERRRTEQVKARRRVLPWIAVGIGAAALIGGGLLYATSETDDGSQPTYRDTRPAGIGVAIGGGLLAGTGVFWVAVF